MEGAVIFQEFAQYVANAGLTNLIAAECEQYHLLTNTFLQSFNFLPRNNRPEVKFNLYAEFHQTPLTEFCEICLLPSDGGLVEPRPAKFDSFYRTLIVGDERGATIITAAGLHFPAVHYFALFIAKCLLAREKVGALSAPTLLFYVVHLRATTLIASELLWHAAFTLINPRVKYMVVFTLLVWRLICLQRIYNL